MHIKSHCQAKVQLVLFFYFFWWSALKMQSDEKEMKKSIPRWIKDGVHYQYSMVLISYSIPIECFCDIYQWTDKCKFVKKKIKMQTTRQTIGRPNRMRWQISSAGNWWSLPVLRYSIANKDVIQFLRLVIIIINRLSLSLIKSNGSSFWVELESERHTAHSPYSNRTNANH